jgi:gluconolactonase
VALKLDPKKSALIIQDLQNDVIMPGGAFTSPDPAPAEHAKKQNVVANVKALAAAARAAGMPVVHVWYIVEPGAVGVKQNAPLFQAVKATNGLVRGSRGAAPVKGLEAKRGDHVVEKTRMNAFHGTNLDNLLRGLGAETVVITGAWTNFSIEHTARHAADAGYNAVVVTDGTSTIDDDWQNAALNYALVNIAERVSTADVLAALERRGGAKAAPRRRAPARRKPPAKAGTAARRR